MKTTQGKPSHGTGSDKNRGQIDVVSKAAPKATPPLATQSSLRKPLREPMVEPRTQARTLTCPNSGPDAHALALLANIDQAAYELPSLIPEAKEDDEIAQVGLAGEPEDPSEAWEYLDPVLNRLLGYGVDIEDIAQRVRRGPLGVEGLTRYIKSFVVDYRITGALLEGKLERLLKAIELLKQSVLITLSNE